ncbi:exodeoxyribonuclease VII small subunit [Jatrophihabitans sp. YIM 134969]
MSEKTGGGPPMPTSYEQARTELAEIVRALEAGSQSLEESLALWERGEALAALCETWLQAARERLAAGTGDTDDH